MNLAAVPLKCGHLLCEDDIHKIQGNNCYLKCPLCRAVKII